jgi:hypothetical protein
MKLDYPFLPKSNSKLSPGHFWAIQLDSGEFGCGIVLDIPEDKKNHGTKSIYIGLLNWKGAERPNQDILNNSKLTILKEGRAHVKTITSKEEQILGLINLKQNKLFISPCVDARFYSECTYVLQGYMVLRKSTKEDHENLKNQSSWGYDLINILANKLL